VPVVEAEQVVQSLTERGVPVEYVLFPDEGHGFVKTTNHIQATVAIVRWFVEHLKPRRRGSLSDGHVTAGRPAAG
jgi:dipeptidyl aminopeptidase/acylaminoacyl peptidase